MASHMGNRAKETSTSTGTGTISLAGPPSGFQALVSAAAAVSGDAVGPWEVYYSIVLGSEWEVGRGTLTNLATDTLSRDAVLESSAGGAKVNFSAGTKDVFLTLPAQLVNSLTNRAGGNGLLKRTAEHTYGVEALPLAVASGGTGSTSAPNARTALGVDDATLDTKYVRNGGSSPQLLAGTLASRPAAGSSTGYVYITTDTSEIFRSNGVAWFKVGTGISSVANFANNACGYIGQRGTTFTNTTRIPNSDNNYTLDRWKLLSNGNNVADVDRELSDVPAGAISAIKLTVRTANQKFGIAQPLNSIDTAAFKGGSAAIAFEAKISGSGISKIKCGIIAMTGGVKDATGDPISSWGADDVTPSLNSGYVFEGSSSFFTPTSTWTRFTLTGISIDEPTINNLILFIWSDDLTTSVSTDILYISKIQVVPSATVPTFVDNDFAQDYARCQMYYAKSFRLADAPNDNVSEVGAILLLGSGDTAGSDVHADAFWNFPVKMFKVPSITFYHPSSGTAGQALKQTGSVGSLAVSAINIGESGVGIDGGITTDTSLVRVTVQVSADAEI